MAVLAAILLAADVNPVVTAILGLKDQLVEIRMLLEPVHPTVGNVHVGVRLVVIPVSVDGLWDADVSSLAQGVLRSRHTANLEIE